MTMTKAAKAVQDQERANTLEKLRGWLRPGDTVQTILRHVSSSGMSRAISLIIVTDGEPFDISFWAARAMRDKIDERWGGIKVGGCGMDMGFHLVYSLSRTLWPEGFDCIGADCPANDHHNPPYPAREAGAMHHRDGGHALTHRWL
jgi:hypothetical protein